MNLIYDIGNTRTKISVFDGGEQLWCTDVTTPGEWISEVPWQRFPITRAAVCSVGPDAAPLVEALSQRVDRVLQLSASTPLPIRLGYETPATLGADRIAAVCGAYALAPGKNCLVVDCGTAVTYDFLDAEGVYHGGNIAPGVRLRLKSLHEHTSRLPLVDPVKMDKDFPLLGTTTQQAIAGGVMQGVLFEMEGYRRKLRRENGPILTFLTGGDAFCFEKRLKSPIFVCSNLVSIGLDYVLNWNETR